MPRRSASAMLVSCFMSNIIILGTGTGIGKTFVSCALARGISKARPNGRVIALKPIESGTTEPPRPEADASQLALASSPPIRPPRQPYCFPEPLSPHLAARRAGRCIDLNLVFDWIDTQSKRMHNTLPDMSCHDSTYTAIKSHAVSCHDISHRPADTPKSADQPHSIGPSEQPAEHASSPRSGEDTPVFTLVETAGAVFSPLNETQTNFELANAIPNSLWLLVAPDRLGVLHDLKTTLFMMKQLGRAPDLIVLSQPDPNDPSLGTNAEELAALQICDVCATVPHGRECPSHLTAAILDAFARHP